MFLRFPLAFAHDRTAHILKMTQNDHNAGENDDGHDRDDVHDDDNDVHDADDHEKYVESSKRIAESSSLKARIERTSRLLCTSYSTSTKNELHSAQR